jgi:transcription elongation factor GreB
VSYANEKGEERTVKIVGVDEADLSKGHVSWMSPIARAVARSEPFDARWHPAGLWHEQNA